MGGLYRDMSGLHGLTINYVGFRLKLQGGLVSRLFAGFLGAGGWEALGSMGKYGV